jgi:signal transduction histidine kinase
VNGGGGSVRRRDSYTGFARLRSATWNVAPELHLVEVSMSNRWWMDALVVALLVVTAFAAVAAVVAVRSARRRARAQERSARQAWDVADRRGRLAARMRRRAESIAILSGGGPSRLAEEPVELADVVREAVSSVAGHARVRVSRLGEGWVAGAAAVDLVHVLAELLDNATAHSPETQPVSVSGYAATAAYVVEVEDRGSGVLDGMLAELNRRLMGFGGAGLGLPVVAGLAARHGVRVSLAANAYNGLTAVVVLPGAVLVAAPEVGDGLPTRRGPRHARRAELPRLERRAARDAGVENFSSTG